VIQIILNGKVKTNLNSF